MAATTPLQLSKQGNEKHMSLLLAALYPESYTHAAESAPRRVNQMMTEQRGAPRPVRINRDAKAEVTKLLNEGVLTVSEIQARTEIPKSTVCKVLRDLSRDGKVVIEATGNKNLPARHYLVGHVVERPDLSIEQLIQDGVLTLGEMLARSGMARSTVFQILRRLQKNGLIEIVVDEDHILPARHYWRG